MRVLIIEPDRPSVQKLWLMLRADGFQGQFAELGEQGVSLAKDYDFDAITLALDLPDISGLDVLRQIRAAGVKTPVLVVTSDTRVETKVKAFAAGADDYLTKPVHRDELVSRLHALARRAGGHATAALAVGPLTVNAHRREVRVDGVALALTPSEYRILELMALRKGAIVSKDAFLNHLYGGLDEPEPKIIDVFICKLRKKLVEVGAGSLLRTVWGCGYTLTDEPDTKHPTKRPHGTEVVPEGQRFRLLSALEAEPATVAGLTNTLRTLPALSLLTAAVEDGLAREEPVGLFALTDAGRAWLQAHAEARA